MKLREHLSKQEVFNFHRFLVILCVDMVRKIKRGEKDENVQFKELPSRRKSRAASVVSGSLSGAFVSACIQPLDVIRTRMQADAACGSLVSTSNVVGNIFKEGGLPAFWRGTQPTVIRLGIGAGLHFFFLESLKPVFETYDSSGNLRLSSVGAAVTGGLSRALAAFVSCPITVVKTRMEYGGTVATIPRYKNTLQGLGTIAREEGLRGLYRGIVPTVLSNAPFSALYYLFYTRLRDNFKTSHDPSAVVNFASGTVAAIAATLITQPADVIRTRMQLNLTKDSMASGITGHVSVGGASLQSVFRQVTASQGTRGLLVGAAPRIMKRTLQTALVWTLYEELAPRFHSAAERMNLARN